VTSSGTYAFSPGYGALTLDAFDRLQMPPASLLVEHLNRAAAETNLLLASWSNSGPLLWKTTLQSVPLVQGTTVYTLPAYTTGILAAYVSTTSGGVTTDRIIMPISTVDYAGIPNKGIQSQPTTYWFNRQIAPQINVWPVPDGNGPYTLNLQTMIQIQDAALSSGQTPDMPYRWLDAFVAGLAHRLARTYKPALEAIRKADAEEAWGIAANQDVENVSIRITPALGSYYR
jgi:hypothetical protein